MSPLLYIYIYIFFIFIHYFYLFNICVYIYTYIIIVIILFYYYIFFYLEKREETSSSSLPPVRKQEPEPPNRTCPFIPTKGALSATFSGSIPTPAMSPGRRQCQPRCWRQRRKKRITRTGYPCSSPNRHLTGLLSTP